MKYDELIEVPIQSWYKVIKCYYDNGNSRICSSLKNDNMLWDSIIYKGIICDKLLRISVMTCFEPCQNALRVQWNISNILEVCSGDKFSRMRFFVDGWHRKHIGQFYLCKEVFQPSKSWSLKEQKLYPCLLSLWIWVADTWHN